jgi:hypothetical protein
VDPGKPLKNQIVDMTVFMSVARVTGLIFGYRGTFSHGVLEKQQKRQVKETFWMPSSDHLRRADKSGSESTAGSDNDATEMVKSPGEQNQNQPQKPSARGALLGNRKPAKGKMKPQSSSSPASKSSSEAALSTTSSNASKSIRVSNASSREGSARARVKSVPAGLGDFREVSYIASNQWSVACRVQCRQEVTEYDLNGGGVVVKETRRLPDIPYGRTFVLVRKISIVFQAENVTRLLISTEVNMLEHKSWPKGVESSIDSEITSMVRTEEKIHSDALMALDDGKSLRKLFQKPEEVAKEKTRRFAVLGITSIAVALVAVLLCWFVWNRAVLRSESTAAVLVVSD